MPKAVLPTFITGAVTSADGTQIGYCKLGKGPAIIIVHGGMQYWKPYIKLAATLSESFTVYIPDRRGRGMSGPAGPEYSIEKECQDIATLVDKSGASYLFGHSSGALIALQAASELSSIHKIALFEPPLSSNGSVPTAWLPKFEKEIAEGKSSLALITATQGIELMPKDFPIPPTVIAFFFKIAFWLEKQEPRPLEVPIEVLVPTQALDMKLVKDMADTLDHFKTLNTEVLLMGGEKSPAFLTNILKTLDQTLPHVEWIEYPDLDHSAPMSKAAERVGQDLVKFFNG